MNEIDDEDDFYEPQPWPWWVSLGLWGVSGRGAAWVFFWFSLLMAVACLALGFVFTPAFLGFGLVLASLWYYAAIRWVDQYSKWP
jgi:hypothetical protein